MPVEDAVYCVALPPDEHAHQVSRRLSYVHPGLLLVCLAVISLWSRDICLNPMAGYTGSYYDLVSHHLGPDALVKVVW